MEVVKYRHVEEDEGNRWNLGLREG